MKLAFILIFTVLSGYLFGQGEYLWTTQITGTYNLQDYGDKDLFVDNDGFIYVTASYQGTVLDTTAISALSNDFNVLVAKFDNYGQLMWATQLDGPENNLVYGITVDNYKNVYIVGGFMDSLILNGIFLAEASSSNEQLYVLKLDLNGNYEWHFTPDYATNISTAYDIEVDNSENCYVVGSFIGNLQLGNDTLVNYGGSASKQSGMYFKLFSNGTVDWYRQMQGTYDSFDETGTKFTNICPAGNDEYFIAGNFCSYGYFDTDTIYTVSGYLNNQDAVIGRINNQGDFIWRYHYGCIISSSWDPFTNIYNMEANDNGELCISGTWGGGANSGNLLTIGPFQFSNAWNEDIYFAKFTPGGNLIWAENMSGGNNPDFPVDMSLDPSGNYMISAIMSQTNGFADTTISGLNPNHKGSFKLSGNDGSFIYYHHSYPSGDATVGFPPHYEYDQYGNLYTFGKANSIIGSNQYGLFLNKKSSGDVNFSGTVFHDADLDSIIDIGERLLPNVMIVGDSGMFYKTTDSLGYYQVSLDTNNHYFEVVPPQYWFISYPGNPNGHTTSAPYLNNSIGDLNFGLSMYPDIIDDQISVTSTNYVPGFSTKFTIGYKNIGTDTSSGTIKLIYDNTLIYDSTNYAVFAHVGDTIFWSYDSLLIGENRQFDVYFSVPANVALLGDTLTSYASISPDLTDTNLVNNVDTISKVVVGAYDPNYKANSPTGILTSGFITEADSVFEYEIHFQNTGTASAVNIFLVDTLDSNLDVTTFEMLVASHNYFYEIYGPGIVKWTFENIMLPDSGANYIDSQGFVKFKIKIDTPKPPGTTIENKAYIFFDFNPPIITNTTINTIYECYNIPFNISTTNLCQNDSIIAYSTEGSMNDYNWYVDGVWVSNSDTLIWTTDSAYTLNLTLVSSNLLCSKDTSLSILINPSYQTSDNDQFICQGDSVLIYGIYRSTGGVYEQVLNTINGCDSVHSTNLFVNPVYNINDSSYVICQGDSLLIYGNYQNQNGIYSQVFNTTEGCDSIHYSDLTVVTCTGIEEQNNFGVRVYPNLGRGIFTIEFSNSVHKEGIIRIFNINSAQVFYDVIPENTDQWQFDIQALENGIYFIHIDFEESSFVEKLLKF